MSAPWGAIVQAIDHTLGRMHEGMGSGIKVADSQGGGAVDSSNATGSIANTSQAGDSLKEATNASTKLDMNKTVGSEESSGNGDVDVSIGGDSGGEDSEGGGGDDILSDERLKYARKHAENTVKNWHRK